MAWYEIHTSKAIFNKQFAAPPRVGEQLWLHTGEHIGSYVVERVVHTEFDEHDERPSTWLFVEVVRDA